MIVCDRMLRRISSYLDLDDSEIEWCRISSYLDLDDSVLEFRVEYLLI